MGTPAAAETISMSSDPRCMNAGAKTEAVIVSGDGSLQNVVRLREGRPRQPQISRFPPRRSCSTRTAASTGPTSSACRSASRSRSSTATPTLHNIHAWPMTNQEFNDGQALQGLQDTHVFSTNEVMVPFKCDVHRWMNSFVGVLDHPFFAVTGADGSFSLKGLPPGTYTIEVWHEKLGTKTAERDHRRQGNQGRRVRVRGLTRRRSCSNAAPPVRAAAAAAHRGPDLRRRPRDEHRVRPVGARLAELLRLVHVHVSVRAHGWAASSTSTATG